MSTGLPENDLQPVVMERKPALKDGRHSWLSLVGLLLMAPLVALFITLFVFQSYQVSGESMEPTLQDQDRLIVWKLPHTWGRLTHHQHIPDRGDIVIFTEPKIAAFGRPENEELIKRVVGLPGERVVVKDGRVTVYNHDNPTGFRPDDRLPYGKSLAASNHDADETMGDDELFVIGDNRINSTDSRYLGPIKVKNIKGTLAYRILPADTAGRF